MAEQSDEEGFHEGDADAVVGEKEFAFPAGECVHKRVGGPKGEHRVEFAGAPALRAEVDIEGADAESEPADADGDGFGFEFATDGVKESS